MRILRNMFNDKYSVIEQAKREKLILTLLNWYDVFGRTLPWRASKDERPNPYWVWVSEVMLQQTTVSTVVPRFIAFVNRWPKLQDLADATVDEVLHEWQGLGYYSRAHSLHKSARIISSKFNGVFPKEQSVLLTLPGIGQYTSAAIAAIAYNKPTLPIDVNIERVFARMFAIGEPLPDRKKKIKVITDNFVYKTHPGDFAQALMDLGATICKSRQPNCTVCPWVGECLAHAHEMTTLIPVALTRKPIPKRYGIVFWAEQANGAVLLRKRPSLGLFSGMMEVPSTPWKSTTWDIKAACRFAPLVADWSDTELIVKHRLTHFQLELRVYFGRIKKNETGLWVSRDQFERYALPTVMKKIVQAVKELK